MLEQDNKKFLVIGLGPIGGIFACHLKGSGCTVFGVDVIQDYINVINSEGLTIEGLTSKKAKLDGVSTKLSDFEDTPFDYVVIAVKAPYMSSIVSELKGFTGDPMIVSMQNGIDTEEYLATHFGQEKTMRIVINFAGNVLSPGKIKMTFFHKPNYVGCLCKTDNCSHQKKISQLMTQAQLETEQTGQIKKHAWKKTLLNSVLAPLSALLGMTMAEVMSCNETRSLVELLFKEGLQVAQQAGYDYGEEFFQQGIGYLSGAGHHKPSMLIDIEKGNPTEIDFINGKIADYGKRFNIPVPLNTVITNLIKAKEKFPR
jgi:2-dehydropantoate 2-reductase